MGGGAYISIMIGDHLHNINSTYMYYSKYKTRHVEAYITTVMHVSYTVEVFFKHNFDS